MKYYRGLVVFSVIVLFFSFKINAYTQCSDAGVCSIGSHKNMEENETHTNSSISLSDRIGYSGKDDDVTYNSIVASGSFGLSPNFNASFSIPFNMQSGPAGNYSGIGDLILGLSYNQPINKDASINFQVGGKFATGDANQGNSLNGTSLPLVYQSGMGTNDILVGATYNYRGFAVTLGGQFPLDRSKNTYSQLKRAPDVLLGLSYIIPANDKLYITAEVLTIKRITESNAIFGATNNSSDDIGVDIPDSDFLQMNIQASFNYLVSRNFGLNLSGAVPLLKRNTNLDGTKRAFTVSAGASYYFNLVL